jgi:hypothetical protein
VSTEAAQTGSEEVKNKIAKVLKQKLTNFACDLLVKGASGIAFFLAILGGSTPAPELYHDIFFALEIPDSFTWK